MIDDSTGPVSVRSRSDIVAAFGLRAIATHDELLALLDSVLAMVGASRSNLTALATFEAKASNPALNALSATLHLPIVAVSAPHLRRPVPNPSERVGKLLGLPSVAEAAALHFGPLLVEKQRSANATCALSLYASPRSSASRASSTLLASLAGP